MTRTLLSFAAISLLTAGSAAAQQPVRVPVGDLDLSTRAGAAAFDARVASEARDVCLRGPRSIPDSVCVQRIQREALRQLPQSRQDEYARARGDGSIQAMVTPARPA